MWKEVVTDSATHFRLLSHTLTRDETDRASSTAAHFGGNAAVLADGKISAPTYTINGNTYNNVGAALAAATTSSDAASTAGQLPRAYD